MVEIMFFSIKYYKAIHTCTSLENNESLTFFLFLSHPKIRQITFHGTNFAPFYTNAE